MCVKVLCTVQSAPRHCGPAMFQQMSVDRKRSHIRMDALKVSVEKDGGTGGRGIGRATITRSDEEDGICELGVVELFERMGLASWRVARKSEWRASRSRYTKSGGVHAAPAAGFE